MSQTLFMNPPICLQSATLVQVNTYRLDCLNWPHTFLVYCKASLKPKEYITRNRCTTSLRTCAKQGTYVLIFSAKRQPAALVQFFCHARPGLAQGKIGVTIFSVCLPLKSFQNLWSNAVLVLLAQQLKNSME